MKPEWPHELRLTWNRIWSSSLGDKTKNWKSRVKVFDFKTWGVGERRRRRDRKNSFEELLFFKTIYNLNLNI